MYTVKSEAGVSTAENTSSLRGFKPNLLVFLLLFEL